MIGWGVLIYAVLDLSWAGFTLYGLGFFPLGPLLQLSVLTIITTAATRSLGFYLWPDVLPYSITWAGVAISLDIIYKVPFIGWSFFSDWTLWVFYSLIVIIPLVTLKRSKVKKELT